jgi:hypothetical protein
MATARRLAFYLSLAVLASSLLAAPGFAGKKKQEPYAVVAGTVFDSNFRAVPGVKVKIGRLEGEKVGKTWEHISDRRGEFAQRVPAGAAEYLVWAEIKPAKGAPEGKRPEARVSIQNDERQDVSLHLTSIESGDKAGKP